MSSLSQELIEDIIDLLSDDRDALISCSYASGIFYRRTRKHLFSSVTFSQCGSDRDLSRARLLAETPLVAIQVKQVQIDHHTTISTLFLHKQPSLSSLVSLDLNFVRFSEPNDLHIAVLSLPLLKELNIKQCYFEELKSSIPALPPTVPKIERLFILYAKGGEALLDPLMSLRRVYMDSLVQLSLQNPSSDTDFNRLIEYSHCTTNKLETLSLAWIDGRDINAPIRHLCIAGLKELNIGITYEDLSMNLRVMQWLVQSLLQPGSRGPRKLTLRIFVGMRHNMRFSSSEERWMPLLQVDRALPTTRIGIVWVCKGYRGGDLDHVSREMVALARRQFPEAHNRGMLEVTVCT
ncbi:hypothetical protein IW261DRAFT_1467041 [Armillaria novae-zelandiae]|uniref:Uncharacterized protein n=1 Tax=Armillaria novae-zelandiae TaxID=153914 RepID=A0AA39PEA2_9AGAR|nr:hypothetical protein IW261DRAFT_1467041 [Armillaria novae-zelandiae]